MARIPKLKRWICRHTWTNTLVEVSAPNRVLAKLNAAHALDMPLVRYGEFTARLCDGRTKETTK